MQNKTKLDQFIHLCYEKRKALIVFYSAIAVISVVIVLLMPNWYESKAVILPNATSSGALNAMSIISNLGIGGNLFGGKVDDYNRYLAILKSRALKDKLISKYNLHEKYGNQYYINTLRQIDDYLKVEVGDEMQIEISFMDKDQDLVQDMTRSIIFWLDSINIELSVKEARQNREFVGSRFDMALDSVIQIENDISRFMREQKVIDLENQLKYGIEQAAQLKAEILSKEVELYSVRSQYSKDNPLVQLLELQVESMQKKFDEFFYNGKDNNLIPPFSAVPEISKKYLEIQRRAEYNRKILEFLAPQYEQTRIEEARTTPTIQILDEPDRPERKVKPKRSIIVIVTMLISMIISLYYIYWVEYVLPRYPFLNPRRKKS